MQLHTFKFARVCAFQLRQILSIAAFFFHVAVGRQIFWSSCSVPFKFVSIDSFQFSRVDPFNFAQVEAFSLCGYMFQTHARRKLLSNSHGEILSGSGNFWKCNCISLQFSVSQNAGRCFQIYASRSFQNSIGIYFQCRTSECFQVRALNAFGFMWLLSSSYARTPSITSDDLFSISQWARTLL